MKRAFTLVETLVASFILVLTISFCMLPFKNTMQMLRLYKDRRIAENRILTVETIIKSAFENCGVGISKDPQEYKAGFGNKNRAPFNWNGALSITNTSQANVGKKLRVAYTMPTECLSEEKVTIDLSGKTIFLTEKANKDYFAVDIYDKAQSVKNWIIFEGARQTNTPLLVTDHSADMISVRSKSREVTIPKGSRLMLFRALECYCTGDKFYTNDFRSSGEQPREDGICAIDFDYDDIHNLLTVRIIARGDDENISAGRIEGAEKCTPDMLLQWQNKSQYVLYCEKFVLHAANLTK
ncbi:MAG: hypothetical protein Q4E17_01065 [Synergistes sp.]|nr:hypothetical protein [Synergistes sp.]